MVRLGDVCEKITDGTHHSPPNGPVGDFKYITAKNIKPWGLDLCDITYIDAATHREIYARCDVRKNDVLYVKDGATAGRLALNTLDEEFSLLSSVGVLRPGPRVRPKYLVYALQSPQVKDRMLADVAGVAITRLTLKKLKGAEIPLAPISQQDSIVAEIEKQFSRLDEAVANLKRVKANLKRYKAAVLKAAVEGRLVETEAERARRKTPSPLAGEGGGEGARSYETGAQLLQRILETRRSQWFIPGRGQGKGKYKEPAAPDTTDLPELPEGWVWAR
jgi:type I restriction enzyme S subunit